MTKYPEKIPQSKPIDTFTFSINASESVRSQIQSDLNVLESRLDRIINEVLLDGVPLIRFIIQTSRDKKELKKLAKAIDRVAELIEYQDKLQSKLSVIDFAKEDPSWFALTFGDFSQDIDNEINNILNNKD